MDFQEMLETSNINQITDAEIKAAAYGIRYADLPPGPQFDRQRNLRIRLEKIEAAEKAAMRKRVSLSALSTADWYADDDDGYY